MARTPAQKKEKNSKQKEQVREIKEKGGTVAITDCLRDLAAKRNIFGSPIITHWNSTGIYLPDLAICAGLPGGRAVEYSGPSSAGKTLAACTAIAACQAAGGIGVYLDPEFGLSVSLATKLGGVSMDPDCWAYFAPETAEETMDLALDFIPLLASTNRPAILVVDSIPALMPSSEKNLSLEDESPQAALTRLLHRFYVRVLRVLGKAPKVSLIMINHIRMPRAASRWQREEEPKVPGGMAAIYYPSVRVRISQLEDTIVYAKDPVTKKEDREVVLGAETEFRVIKNRVGPPRRVVTFPAYFVDSMPWVGIDDAMTCLNWLVRHQVLTSGNHQHFKFIGDPPGQPGKLKAVLQQQYHEDPKFKAYVQALTKQVSMTYWRMQAPNGQLPPEALIATSPLEEALELTDLPLATV